MSLISLNLNKVRPLAEEELPAPVPGRILVCFFTNKRTSIQRAARRDTGQGRRVVVRGLCLPPNPICLAKLSCCNISNLSVAQENWALGSFSVGNLIVVPP
ncbi:unnamed protein product [Pipistrellus nathusii]|uniref:Uncharacterized protein n=1 Tax=Pipistrellus nathusii TaxID=59473 RepID=A0ABN9Z0S0_PIPNA